MIAIPEYWLHYVGKGLYTPQTFKREAEIHGVSRAIPLNCLKALNWGDIVLLAQYNSEKRSAEVFGYFIIETISHNLPAHCSAELRNMLNVEKIEYIQKYVARLCGSYKIESIAIVKDDLKDIADKIQKIVKKYKEKPKIFIGGTFYELDPFELQNTKFTRSLIKVGTDQIHIVKAQVLAKRLIEISDYKQRKRLPKRAIKFPGYIPQYLK